MSSFYQIDQHYDNLISITYVFGQSNVKIIEIFKITF